MTLTPFVRKSSGIVREISLFNVFGFNVGSVSISYAIVVWTFLISVFPGADWVTLLLFTALVTVPHLVVYAGLSAAMPRSGGDYIFVSRIVHPVIGWITNFILIETQFLFLGISATWISSTGLSNALSVTGFVTGNQSLIAWGSQAATPTTSFIVGTIALVGMGLICLRSVKTFFKLQTLCFTIGVIGIIALWASLLPATHEQFVARFNDFALPLTQQSDSYAYIIATAKQLGVSLAMSPINYLTAVSIFLLVTGWTYFSSYMSGEIKQGGSFTKQFAGMLGSLVFVLVLVIVTGVLMERVVGHEFLYSVFYVALVNPSSLGSLPIAAFSPTYTLFPLLITSNVIVTVLAGAGIIAWTILPPLVGYIAITRCIFAWSFDRLVPTRLADIHPKYHAPVNAVIVTMVFGEIFLVIFTLVRPDLLTYALVSGSVGAAGFPWLWAAISAIVFPKRLGKVYEGSSLTKLRVGPIPLISLAGVLSAIVMVSVEYAFWTQPQPGNNNPIALGWTFIALPCIALGIYTLSYFYRKRQGIDLGLAFKEIPPV